MGRSAHILKKIYVITIAVIYLLFFSVHCVFKYTYFTNLSDNSPVSTSSPAKGAEKNFKIQKVQTAAYDGSVRLNKRFHPESNFLVAPIVAITTLIGRSFIVYHTFYENPVQSLVCLSKCMRGPPAVA